MIISILPSDKKGKKWMAKVDETGQTIYFGQAGAEDFTTHKDELKRKRWIARHKVEPWKPEVNLTPAWLSRYLLWEKDDMNKALAAASVMYPDIRFRWGSPKAPPKAPPPPPPKAPSPARASPARESPARESPARVSPSPPKAPSPARELTASERDAQIRALLREFREFRDEYTRAQTRHGEYLRNGNMAQAEEEDVYLRSLLRKMQRRQRAIDALVAK
jgi:hypothetical protein